MSYEYAKENINYEDYSSGRVFYNQQGATSFPVRLTCEIFMRCTALMEKVGNNGPYNIYDPLCGGAYSLATLGFLCYSKIGKIYASDVDEAMVGLAEKNLSLLSVEGLERRIQQIEGLLQEYGKESHRDALQSGRKLQNLQQQMPNKINTECFIADAMRVDNHMFEDKLDIVITDLPYGEVVDWVSVENEAEAIKLLLVNLLPKLAKNSVVAITSKKRVDIRNEHYRRVERFTIGKRQIVLLQPIIK